MVPTSLDPIFGTISPPEEPQGAAIKNELPSISKLVYMVSRQLFANVNNAKGVHNIHATILESLVPSAKKSDEGSIDMAKILNAVGPQVVSTGTLLQALQGLGDRSSATLEGMGNYTSTLFDRLDKSETGSTLLTLVTHASKAFGMLMVLPYGKQFVSSMVLRCGLPFVGHALFLMPIIVQRLLPYLAPINPQSDAFWTSCAVACKSFFHRSAVSSKATTEEFGIWLQQQYNAFFAKMTQNQDVDPSRIQNFQTLSPLEQKHLFELTHATATDEKAIKRTLRALDRMTDKELLALTPTSYGAIDPKMQLRVQNVIYKYGNVQSLKPLDPKELVERFNALSHDQKAEIYAMTQKEYSELPQQEQDDIRFLVEHSKGYNKALDTLVQYSRLGPQERAIMTPTRLKMMSEAKMAHLKAILKTDSSDPWTLASLYNKLPISKKLELLEITPEEWATFTPEKKALLAKFMAKEAIKSFNELDHLKMAEWRLQDISQPILAASAA